MDCSIRDAQQRGIYGTAKSARTTVTSFCHVRISSTDIPLLQAIAPYVHTGDQRSYRLPHADGSRERFCLHSLLCCPRPDKAFRESPDNISFISSVELLQALSMPSKAWPTSSECSEPSTRPPKRVFVTSLSYNPTQAIIDHQARQNSFILRVTTIDSSFSQYRTSNTLATSTFHSLI